MVSKLKAENFHLVTIADLHIANLPKSGYAPATTPASPATTSSIIPMEPSTNTGAAWPGPSVFPGLLTLQSLRLVRHPLSRFRHSGVAGFRDDMNEPSHLQ